MSVNYEPGGDVLIPEEMRERFEREALERALNKPVKPAWGIASVCVVIALGLMVGGFCFLIHLILERSGN